MILRRMLGSALILIGVGGCSENGTGPDDDRVSLAVQSGDGQFAAPGQTVLDPLQVIVTDPVSKDPLENVAVTWSVVSGNGAVVTPPTSNTNEDGVATATLQLGAALGNYEVQASAANSVSGPARFVARAVNPPSISSAPQQTDVGDTITIAGSNFSTQPDDNLVLFGGFRGRVISATATQLRAIVPTCVPARTVALTVSLGAVSSAPAIIQVNGSTTSALQLARGEVRTISDPAELGCFQLPGGIPNYSVLLIPQNATDVAGRVLSVQLAGLTGGGVSTNLLGARTASATTDLPLTFETKLRTREREILARAHDPALRPQSSVNAAACPASAAIGSRCDFKVINKDDDFVTVNAELKAISARALIYQDLNAPSNGLSTADFQTLGATFDDPIYSAVSGAFGTPSDIDANNKVIILLTPVVNEMTPRGPGSGFIAGFFYGCDLVSVQQCSGTNRSEIFYTLTADPSGQFSNARSVGSVLSSLPAVLAHEFQHMINFGQRQTTDALWLSEGMAHHAEDVVADVYAARGDATNAERFRAQNRLRADRYLRDPSATSLIAEGGTGTLELRGGSWLFVKYLAGQFGATVLRNLTQANQSSVTNVTQQTGRAWSVLMANWAVALYADDAPELAGATVRPEYTYPNMNLRSFMQAATYPLRPLAEQFADFTFRVTLPAASQEYIRVQATVPSPSPLSLNLAGTFGGSFPANAAPQLSIVRLQ
ncbi:MAG TPA: IPT/TIG domain-containing protein [Longimicrobiales bacterium]